MGIVYSKTATIAASASLSNGVQLSDSTPYLLILPAAWTAANITFQVSMDNTTYGTLYTAAGTIYTLTTTYTAASSGVVRAIPIDPVQFGGFKWLKVQSGTDAAPVVQAAERLITIGIRDA